MNMVLTIYFSVAAVLASLISLWHIGYFLRHGHWNSVSMSTSEDSDRMPGWMITVAFAVLAIASSYGAVLCLRMC